jgi:hypothetical protein
MEENAMRFVGWFEFVTGLAIAALWSLLLATGQVPELTEGRRDILFHIGAELLTALLLIAAGIAVLRVRGQVAAVFAALAAGALLYTTINSAGYYADLGQWQAVAIFAVLTVATVTAATALIRSVSD